MFYVGWGNTAAPHSDTRSWRGGGDEPDQIKLLESSDQKEQYISLSHCWGGEKPLITTRATLDDHKAGIAFSSLPKTFQDAVKITRKLGIRYLWIDSLCIVQDDPADWQAEASRMATTYRNSWLTVSATSSTSPSSGVFKTGQAAYVTDGGNDDDDDLLSVLFPEATKAPPGTLLVATLQDLAPGLRPVRRTRRQ